MCKQSFLLQFLVLDTSSFERSLNKRRDSAFFTCGQLARFLHRLLSRIASATSFPLATDWFALLTHDLDTLVFLPPSDFLKRLKLRGDLDACSRLKAERDTSQKSGSLAIIELAAKIKETFARESIVFILEFVRSAQSNCLMTTILAKGMASFDSHVLFSLSLDVASRCFGELFSCFRLKKWVQTGDLSLYRDEYLAFVDSLRITHPIYCSDPDSVPDVVNLLTPLASLQTRRRLLYIFQLASLCLTEEGPDFPVVSFGSVTSADNSSNYVDVIQPVQSFLATVPHGVAVCTSEDAISSFVTLQESGFALTLSSSYDPWERNDFFDRQKIYSGLIKIHSGDNLPLSSSVPRGPSASFAVALDSRLVPGRTKRVGFSRVKGAATSSKPSAKRSKMGGTKSADEASRQSDGSNV